MQCQLDVIKYWSRIFRAIHASTKVVPAICNHINENCKPADGFRRLIGQRNQYPKAWDCDTCKEDLKLVVEAASDDKIIGNAMESLKGEALCNGNDECVKFVEDFFPAAVKGLAHELLFRRIGICTDLYAVEC